jgi:MYXO-CTERM domain-containing protein
VTAAVFSLFTTAHPTFFGAGNPPGGALPDDGTFPANADHPLVVLHFSNTAPTTAPQTFQILAKGMSEVAVPQATYSSMYLLMTSSGGGQPNLSVTLKYADGTTAKIAVPLNDYDVALSASTATVTFFNLSLGMHKWGGASAMYPYGAPGDNAGHEVTGVKVATSATKELTSFVLNKMDGNQMMLWGATGVATSPVDAGVVAASGASSGSSTGSASGASTSGGATGASTGGATGASTGAATGATAGATSSSGNVGGAGATSGVATSGSAAAGGTTSGASGAVSATGSATSGTVVGTSGGAGTGSGASSGSVGGGSAAAASPAGGGGGSGCSFAAARGKEVPLALPLLGLCGLVLRRRRVSAS